jgi:hypothetical protein
MLVSISAVALAGLTFFATQGNDNTPDPAKPAAISTPALGSNPIPFGPGGPPTPSPTVTPTAAATPAAPVDKSKTTVVVFNNTTIQGLAGKAATKIEKVGWNVLKTDNWHGRVDASTVYYGPNMKAAAQELATDVGVSRIKPSFAPMNPKMLTVILTTDYR